MIIKLRDGSFRLQQQCFNCKSFKYPHWAANGKILGSATYKYTQAYRDFLNNHDQMGARLAILTSDIKKTEAPSDGKNSTILRQSPPKARRAAARAVKRPRDKKRTEARRVSSVR
jgi:hypothetical protein